MTKMSYDGFGQGVHGALKGVMGTVNTGVDWKSFFLGGGQATCVTTRR